MGTGSGIGETFVVFEAISLTLQILSIAFNGAIICTVWKKSLLQYPSNRFVFSLCLSHLLVSTLSISISIILPMYPDEHEAVGSENINSPCRNNENAILSHILLFVTFAVAVGTSITVALISVERYITIARPMKYKSIVTPRRTLSVIIICWLLSTLIATLPMMIFDKETKVCGNFALPTESLGLYFASVFTIITILALSVMIVCYSHIFTIAKEKCQKVQIGHFTSPVSSISSDWPSSAYSSVEGHKWIHSSSRIASSNSLLHHVLMANLGRHGHAHPLRVPYVDKSTERSQISSHQPHKIITASASAPASYGPRGIDAPLPTLPMQIHECSLQKNSPSSTPPSRRKWRTFLQHNYNSPRKTIVTIGVLIGSVILTQLPLSVVLFTQLEENSKMFYFCYSVLFSFSSLSNPILYGFLNRSIRLQLWKILRIRNKETHKRKVRSQGSFVAAKNFRRRDSISSGEPSFSPNNSRRQIKNEKESVAVVPGVCSDVDTSNRDRNSFNNSINSPHNNIQVDTDSYIYNPPIDSTSTSIDRIIQDFHQQRQDSSSVANPPITNGNECSKSQSLLEIQTISTISTTLVAINDLGESPQLNSIQDELDLQATFPRKTSQDSGADMTFSDDDEEEEDKHVKVLHEDQSVSTEKLNASAEALTLALTLAPASKQEFQYQSQSQLDLESNSVELHEMSDTDERESEPNNLFSSLHLHSPLTDDPGVVNTDVNLGFIEAFLVSTELHLLQFYDDSDSGDEEYDSFDV